MEAFAAFLKLATSYHSKSMSPWVLNFHIIMRIITWHVINSSKYHSTFTYSPYTYMASLQCGSTCDTKETCEFWSVFHRRRKRTCHIKETPNIIYACRCNIHVYKHFKVPTVRVSHLIHWTNANVIKAVAQGQGHRAISLICMSLLYNTPSWESAVSC